MKWAKKDLTGLPTMEGLPDLPEFKRCTNPNCPEAHKYKDGLQPIENFHRNYRTGGRRGPCKVCWAAFGHEDRENREKGISERLGDPNEGLPENYLF